MPPTRQPAFRRFDGQTVDNTAVNQTRCNNVSSTQPTTVTHEYDETGAMQFIVCTIIVYSVGGVFCTFVSRFRKYARSNGDFKTQDEAVNKYLKKEKKLKLEGYKMQMLKEMDKHSENIKRYEERMRLLELERALQTQDFSVITPRHKSRRKSKGFLRRSKKKQPLLNKSKSGGLSARLANRRSSTSDAMGAVGFSLLFMDPANRRLQELQEEDEMNSTADSASCDMSRDASCNVSLSRSNIDIPSEVPMIEGHSQGELQGASAVNGQTSGVSINHLTVIEGTILSSSL